MFYKFFIPNRFLLLHFSRYCIMAIVTVLNIFSYVSPKVFIITIPMLNFIYCNIYIKINNLIIILNNIKTKKIEKLSVYLCHNKISFIQTTTHYVSVYPVVSDVYWSILVYAASTGETKNTRQERGEPFKK